MKMYDDVVDRPVNRMMNLQTNVYRTLKLPTQTAIGGGAKSHLYLSTINFSESIGFIVDILRLYFERRATSSSG